MTAEGRNYHINIYIYTINIYIYKTKPTFLLFNFKYQKLCKTFDFDFYIQTYLFSLFIYIFLFKKIQMTRMLAQSEILTCNLSFNLNILICLM